MRLARTVVRLVWRVVGTRAAMVPPRRWIGGGYKLDGEVRAGGQGGQPPSDLGSSTVPGHSHRRVPRSLACGCSPDELYYGWLAGSKWGRQDQGTRWGRPHGLWGAEWDQTPVYSRNTARLMARDIGRSVFVLPTPRPPRSTTRPGDRSRRPLATARLSLFLTPTGVGEGASTRGSTKGGAARSASPTRPR
jgi:hypothetical protein